MIIRNFPKERRWSSHKEACGKKERSEWPSTQSEGKELNRR